MYKLERKEKEILEKDLYLERNNLVKLDMVNLYDSIKVIVCGCGRGKSTYALSLADTGLLASINHNLKRNDVVYMLTGKPYEPIKPEEMVVLSPRTVIKKQQLKNKNTILATRNDFVDEDFFAIDELDREERKGKIRIYTA